MKFRYYITDLFDGCIKGTNDEKVAKGLVDIPDFFVVDTETGLWLADAGETVDIEEIENPGQEQNDN